MDNVGKGPGHVAVDGAFERFLTAAIATIITIMFSWRLLAEEGENFGDFHPPGAMGRTPALTQGGGSRKEGETQVNNMNSPNVKSKNVKVENEYKSQNGVCNYEVNVNEHEMTSGGRLSCEPPRGDESGQMKPADDDLDEGLDYQSSWAEYDPNEDMYEPFHTRRSVKDFITENKENKKERHSFSDSDTELSENIIPVSHDMLEQLYVNKEYSSIVDSEDFVDLNKKINEEDSESESGSDEGEFELPMVESDEEPYYPSVLEPIMEEETDDNFIVETEIENQETVPENVSRSPSEPCIILPETLIEVNQQSESLLSENEHDMFTQANDIKDKPNHVDLFTTVGAKPPDVENESEYEFKSKPSPLEINENIENQILQAYEEIDSLPESPIRTCALDDKDGYFSDESCSSESVVTVVSVKSYERRKMNENVCLDSPDLAGKEIAIDTEKLAVTGIPSSQENINIPGQAPDQIKDDIIAFIHGVENSVPDQSTEYDLGSSNLNAIPDTSLINKDFNYDNLNVTETTVTPGRVLDYNHKNTNDDHDVDHLKNVSESTVENLSKHSGISYNEFVNELEASGEENLNSEKEQNEEELIRTDDVQESELQVVDFCELNGDLLDEDSPSPLNVSLDEIDVPDDICNHSEAPVGHDSDEGPREFSPDEVPREFSPDEGPREFSSDEGPREYNPEDDDFAHFNSDSDDDSFYLLIGGNEHLRKLETFTNLNVVGLSPGASSGDETTYFDENEKKLVISRTEEVVTDHSVNYYVKDRDLPKKFDNLSELVELKIIEEEKHDKSFEEEQEEILNDLETLLEHESESSPTDENEKLTVDVECEGIDQLSNADKIQPDINFYDHTAKISDINFNCVDIDQIKSQATEQPSDNICQQTTFASEVQSDDVSNIQSETEKDITDKIVTQSVLESPGLVQSSESNRIGKDFDHFEINTTELSPSDGILDPVNQRHEHLNNGEFGVAEEQIVPLIKSVSNDSDKLKSIDNKINSHVPELISLDSPGSVVNADLYKNNEFLNTRKTTGTNGLSSVNKHLPNSSGNIPDSDESDLKSLERTEGNIDQATGVKNGGNRFVSDNENLNDLNSSDSDQISKDSSAIVKLEKSIKPCIEILSHAVKADDKLQSKIDKLDWNSVVKDVKNKPVSQGKSSNSSLDSSFEEIDDGHVTGSRDYHSLPNFSRVVHSSVQRPSGYKGVKGRISKQLQYKPKQYNSVLQQPIIVETHKSVVVGSPEKSLPRSRQKILVSRKRFLSEENLSTLPNTVKDQFSQHKTSLTKTTPRRRYTRKDNNSTSVKARKNLSFDRIDRLRELCHSPRISEDSFEKPEIDTLHADCMFSPHRHEQIMNTTLSIDNLQSHLLRYGSVTSLVETDIDSGETFETRIFSETDIDHDFELQVPLQRTASMSELGNKKRTGRGRFADRNVPKSKSLQTLETNIDDVFTAEGQGNLTRVPSVHELRVTKSLSKLNVPDWYKKSSVSRSGSTFSLYSSSRRDSTSTMSSFGHPPSLTTSPCPSVTPGSNAVVIKTRVTPLSARVLRAPLLPTTPEKSPIPPSILKLPSDKFRQKEKPKELMPIPIVPFSKLRLMFESKSKRTRGESKTSEVKHSAPVLSKPILKTPTSPEVPKAQSQNLSVSPSAKENSIQQENIVPEKQPTASTFPVSSLKDNQVNHTESVTNGRIAHNEVKSQSKPPVPEKPRSLLVNKTSSIEPRSREHHSKHVRYSIPSQSHQSPVQNEQVQKSLASPTSAMLQSESQSRKGKVYDFNDNLTSQYRDISLQYRDTSMQYRDACTHVNLQGELLFDFLQKLRFNRLQENVFTDQLPSDVESENQGLLHYRFPILSVNQQHSPDYPKSPIDDLADTGNLQVVFADASLNGGLDDANLAETSLEDVLSGLLALNENKRKSSSKSSENELVSRKISNESQTSLSPAWSSGPLLTSLSSDSDSRATIDLMNYYDEVFDDEENVVVRCKKCRRESLLKYARYSYKICHHCYTYYCSRHCRMADWEKHKRKCPLSMINSLCKRVIKHVNRDSDTQYHFSRAARRGYLSQGRGCLILAFTDLECAENFLAQGVHSLWLPPLFLSVDNLNDAYMLQDNVPNLIEMCNSYNPELKFVFHVVIPVPNNLPQKPLPRKQISLVQKSAKLRLSPAHMHPEFKENEESSTLILTAVPGGPDVNSISERKSREVCFVNIQRKLRERGVSLRHHYPNIYDKLIEYVADAKHFTPLIIYPYDNRTGKRFMCVIMPESEPDIEWVQERSLFDELDINQDFYRDGVYSISVSSLEDVPETPV